MEEQSVWQSEKANESFWKAYNTPSTTSATTAGTTELPFNSPSFARVWNTPVHNKHNSNMHVMASPSLVKLTTTAQAGLLGTAGGSGNNALGSPSSWGVSPIGTRRKMWSLPVDTENFGSQIIPLKHDMDNEDDVEDEENKENRFS